MNKFLKVKNFKLFLRPNSCSYSSMNFYKLNKFSFSESTSDDKKYKIYTKTGDKGTTALIGGVRKNKDDEIFEVLGDIDELNSYIGLCCSYLNPHHKKEEKLYELIIDIQNHLYHISSFIASQENEKYLKDPKFELKLEKAIDEMEEVLPALTHFINPGGSKAASHFHVARTISRRVERKYVTYSKEKSKTYSKFFNRLSDFFFVTARYSNYIHNFNDILAV